jgi:hypothetical protein
MGGHLLGGYLWLQTGMGGASAKPWPQYHQHCIIVCCIIVTALEHGLYTLYIPPNHKVDSDYLFTSLRSFDHLLFPPLTMLHFELRLKRKLESPGLPCHIMPFHARGEGAEVVNWEAARKWSRDTGSVP